MKPKKEELHREWDRAAERENGSREAGSRNARSTSMTSRRSCERHATLSGRRLTSSAFTADDARRHGATVKANGVIDVDLREAHRSFVEATNIAATLGDKRSFRAAFEEPVDERTILLAERTRSSRGSRPGCSTPRSIPSPRAPPGDAASSGPTAVSRTDRLPLSCASATTSPRRRAGAQSIAEEARVIVVPRQCRGARPGSMSRRGERAVRSRPDRQRRARDAAADRRAAPGRLPALEPHIERVRLPTSRRPFATPRSRAGAGRMGSAKSTVEPHLPVDILGIYVYLPARDDLADAAARPHRWLRPHRRGVCCRPICSSAFARSTRKLPGLDRAVLRPRARRAASARRSPAPGTGWSAPGPTFTDELAKRAGDPIPATTPTRERWLLPLFEELGYGRLSPAKAVEIDGKSYPVSHACATRPAPPRRRQRAARPAQPRAWPAPPASRPTASSRSSSTAPPTASGASSPTAARCACCATTPRSPARPTSSSTSRRSSTARSTPTSRCSGSWPTAPARAAFADGADEGATRPPMAAGSSAGARSPRTTGTRALDRLRDGVEEAIAALGSGFLAHPANARAARPRSQAGELDTQDYYRQLLRLVYRLLFLFVAEDRDLLLDPKADAPSARALHAATTRPPACAAWPSGARARRHADLYAGLRRRHRRALGRDDGAPGSACRRSAASCSGPRRCPHLDAAELANGDLLDAVRALATIEERGVLRAVDYRNLGAEELGSIYESLLELHPELDVDAGTFALAHRRRQRAQDDRHLLHPHVPDQRACSTRRSTRCSTRPPTSRPPRRPSGRSSS